MAEELGISRYKLVSNNCHCEERSDAAIYSNKSKIHFTSHVDAYQSSSQGTSDKTDNSWRWWLLGGAAAAIALVIGIIAWSKKGKKPDLPKPHNSPEPHNSSANPGKKVNDLNPANPDLNPASPKPVVVKIMNSKGEFVPPGDNSLINQPSPFVPLVDKPKDKPIFENSPLEITKPKPRISKEGYEISEPGEKALIQAIYDLERQIKQVEDSSQKIELYEKQISLVEDLLANFSLSDPKVDTHKEILRNAFVQQSFILENNKDWAKLAKFCKKAAEYYKKSGKEQMVRLYEQDALKAEEELRKQAANPPASKEDEEDLKSGGLMGESLFG